MAVLLHPLAHGAVGRHGVLVTAAVDGRCHEPAGNDGRITLPAGSIGSATDMPISSLVLTLVARGRLGVTVTDSRRCDRPMTAALRHVDALRLGAASEAAGRLI